MNEIYTIAGGQERCPRQGDQNLKKNFTMLRTTGNAVGNENRRL